MDKLKLHKLKQIVNELESFKEQFGHLCPKSIGLMVEDIKVRKQEIEIQENMQKQNQESQFPHFPMEKKL